MSDLLPLLSGSNDYESYIQPKRESADNTKSEAWYILRAAAPLVVTFVLQYLLSVTSIYASGKLGSLELAATSLAVCSFNITGLAIYQGMATSLDFFCPQAYGSGNITDVGLYFQRCLALGLAITVCPLALIWWFSGSILKLMVPNEDIVMLAQQYMRIIIIGAPGLLMFETGKRFLQAQHIYNAGIYVLAVASPVNVILHWLLVWNESTGLGFIGAPIAVSITFWLLSILMLLYVLLIDGKKCWAKFESRALTNWKPMLKLAIPGTIMVEAEYLAFEVLTILAASFGTDALAAQSIAANIAALLYQLPFAISVILSTRVSYLIGLEDVLAAKLVIRISTYLSLGISTLNFCIVFFGRLVLSRFFTNSEDVISMSKNLLVLTSINQIADAFNVSGAGILRGQGRQRIGSLLSLFSYYIIALPVGYLLAFKVHIGLPGLWVGLICAVAFLALSEYLCIIKCNWPRILTESQNRLD
ncbi:uncharacterized protein PRCAT00003161001 [Priceomyces carsonii]|uniref:uncharacterized protein n=1 Tax=Priceomyces carsonii TaxID=28549 RepID=UPI002EDB2BCD|nr:unnamed protein product [Priceomyces carsonii]